MDLRTFRKSRGLSQEDVAQALGVTSKGYISDIERGARAASLQLALRIEQWSDGALRAADLSPVAAELGASNAKPRRAHRRAA